MKTWTHGTSFLFQLAEHAVVLIWTRALVGAHLVNTFATISATLLFVQVLAVVKVDTAVVALEAMLTYAHMSVKNFKIIEMRF